MGLSPPPLHALKMRGEVQPASLSSTAPLGGEARGFSVRGQSPHSGTALSSPWGLWSYSAWGLGAGRDALYSSVTGLCIQSLGKEQVDRLSWPSVLSTVAGVCWDWTEGPSAESSSCLLGILGWFQTYQSSSADLAGLVGRSCTLGWSHTPCCYIPLFFLSLCRPEVNPVACVWGYSLCPGQEPQPVT
jgi:hypothetical protein